MSLDRIIIWIMAVGVLIGGLDRIFGNKLGLGEQFEEGFNAMGPLALGMVGIVTLAPVIAKVLGPVIIPIFNFFGADPSMFAAILANDMGGYPLAMELAVNEQAGLVITLANSIPVYKMMKDMDNRGKVINTAWLVTATAALGDHLGFTAGVRPDMITPVVIGKISAGILAIIIASLVSRDLSNEEAQSKAMEEEFSEGVVS